MRILQETDPQNIVRVLASYAGDRAYDVGANCGQTACVLAPHFRHVDCFEPCDESYLVAKNSAPSNVAVHHLAVSDSTGYVELEVHDKHIESGQLVFNADAMQNVYHGWGNFVEKRKVRCSTLDDFVQLHQVPDFVKIDVEGHEVAVVRGAMHLLSVYRPRLLIEVHRADLGEQLVDELSKLYPRIEYLMHPGYPSSSWGSKNHFWLKLEPQLHLAD